MIIHKRAIILFKAIIPLVAICAFLFSESRALPVSAPLEPAKTVVSGFVTDSTTGQPLPMVVIATKKGKKRAQTDANGFFSLSVSRKEKKLLFSTMGYADKEMPLPLSSRDTLRVMMTETPYELAELVVKPKKEKYSKKNNPAVDLMHKIKNYREEHDPQRMPFYSYDKYEKNVIALNDYAADLKAGKKSRTVEAFSQYVDTALWSGNRVLDLILKEKYSTRIVSQQPKADKEIVKGLRSQGIDNIFNQDNMQAILEDVLREVDIFDNDIVLMQNRFVSPLSKIGPDFYKYHITDTVIVGGTPCVELTFAPHNPETMGFNGKIFVTPGDTVTLKRVTMRVPKAINLNYIDNIFISQNFITDTLGNTHKVLDDMHVDIQMIPGTPRLYSRRLTTYDHFSYEKRPDDASFYSKLGNRIVLEEAYTRPGEFWNANRMVSLSAAERNMDNINSSIRKVPFLYYAQKVLSVLEGGYVKTGKNSKFDVGQVNTFLSFNDVEGTRLRVGGITTANLNPHLFGRGYVAYGTKDRKWKYSAEVEYSFNKKKYHSREFCQHGILGLYSYDLDMLGQHYLFTNPDNIFLSLKRKESILVTYRRLAELSYILELPNNFSVTAALKRETQEATRWLPFIYGDGRSVKDYTQTYFKLELRYAPGEKFVQGRTNRAPLNLDSWVFMLTHEIGPRKLFGSDFAMNRTEASIRKRMWFSAFGYADMCVKGGIIWNSVPYPALMWPNANLSYTIQPESYSLMNPMEFANDKYFSWELTYFGNGVLFNRLPLIKKLKMREVFTFNGLMGSLSDRNNPAKNPSLFQFPADARVSTMTKTPYMEIGCGLDNILTFLRVDYVWRLTYRGAPDIDKSGLRVSLHFSF